MFRFLIIDLLIAYCITSANCSTESPSSPSSPILWRPSEHSLGKKIIYQTINFTIHSPCHSFSYWLYKNIQKDPNGPLPGDENDDPQIKDYRKWCQTLYKHLIVKQIEDNCETVDEIRVLTPDKFDSRLESMFHSYPMRTRHGRSFAQASKDVSLLSVFSLLGISTAATFLTDQEQSNRLQEMELNYVKRMKHLGFTIETSNKIHQELAHQISSLNLEMHKLYQQNLLHAQSNKLLMVTTSKLFQIESYFKAFFLSLKNQQISEHFHFLFPNLVLCDEDLCPRKYWIGYGCERLANNRIKPSSRITNSVGSRQLDDGVSMILKMATFIVDQRNKILKLDPFVIMKLINETSVCFYEYGGREFFLYNQEKNCLKEIIFHPTRPSTVMFTYGFSNDDHCSRPSDFLNDLWRLRYCKNKKHLVPEEIVQIKSDQHYNYVYCYTFRMTIVNQTFVCEDMIYRLDRNASFSVGNTTILVQQVLNVDAKNPWTYLQPEMDGILTDLMSDHHGSNVHLAFKPDQLNETKLETLMEQEKSLKDNFNDDRNRSYSHLIARSISYLYLIVFILAMLLLICCCIYCFCCSRRK